MPRLLAAAILPLLLGPLLAQEEEEPTDEPVVWFDEESSIAEGLKRVDASIEKGDTKGSAIWMQKLLNEHAARVMEAPDGTFLPVWRVLSRRIGAMPKDHVEAYLEMYAAEARTSLAAAILAKDLVAVQKAAQSRFPALAEENLLTAVRVLLEAGRRAVAEALLEERVLQGPPSHLCATLLISLYARRGDHRAIQALRAALSPDVRSHRVSVGGLDLTVDEVLDSALGRAISEPPTASPPREPSDAPSWSKPIPVLGEAYDALIRNVNNWAGGTPLDASMPGARKIFPVTATASDDLVLVHLGKSLFAWRLEDGALAWTRGGERNLAAFLQARCETTLCRHYAVVVDGPHAYATFEGRYQETGARNDLVCLSLSEGRPVWKLDEGNAGKDYSFIGVPHLSGDRLYIGVVGTEESEQLSVLCLDVGTGKVLWTCKLASHTPHAEEVWYFSAEPIPVVALHRGVVYVCTGTGGFAGIDPATGEFLWGIKYPNQAHDSETWVDLAQEVCWLLPPNPILPVDEGLWVSPCDAPRFYLVDPVSRAIVDDHRKDALERYRFLVGTTQRGLLLGGPEVGLYEPQEGLLHHWSLRSREGNGRPALAAGRLIIPRAKEVVALDAETFATEWRRPIEPEASGDVLVTERGVALVSPRRVAFFPWK